MAMGISHMATGTRPVMVMPHTEPATTVTLLLVTTTATAVIAPDTRRDMDTVSAALPVVCGTTRLLPSLTGSYLRAGRPDGGSSDERKTGRRRRSQTDNLTPRQADLLARVLEDHPGLTREEALEHLRAMAGFTPHDSHHEA